MSFKANLLFFRDILYVFVIKNDFNHCTLYKGSGIIGGPLNQQRYQNTSAL